MLFRSLGKYNSKAQVEALGLRSWPSSLSKNLSFISFLKPFGGTLSAPVTNIRRSDNVQHRDPSLA